MTSNSRAKEKRRHKLTYQEQGFDFVSLALSTAHQTLTSAIVDLRIVNTKDPQPETTATFDALESVLEGVALCIRLTRAVRPGLSLAYANDYFADYNQALMNLFSEADRQRLMEYRKNISAREVQAETETTDAPVDTTCANENCDEDINFIAQPTPATEQGYCSDECCEEGGPR